ncbi:MAG TPA: STAS domain-containing protein [Gemmatimonadales bacterium]|jgi:anti-anti-sigma regulatory factor
MLRLTRTIRLPHDVVLVLEGQIVGEWVELLEAECLELLDTHRKLFLDLANVSYLDRRGVRLLGKLAARSVILINCPSLLYELVEEDAS